MVDIKDLLRHNGEIEARVEWLEKGLKQFIDGEIFKDIDDNELIEFVKDISIAILDGEPTTADEFNETQIQEGEELMKEYGDHEG